MKKQTIRFLGLFLLAASFFVFSGFKRFQMNYKPISSPGHVKYTRINVKEFEDCLPHRGWIDLKLLFNDHDRIYIEKGISKWVTGALISELAQSRYSVNESASSNLEITGEILQLCEEENYFYNGYIELKVFWKKDGKVIFEKIYEKRGRGGIDWLQTNKAHRKTLNRTLQAVFSDVLEDIMKCYD